MKNKFKEIIHSTYRLDFSPLGDTWEEILKSIGKELDSQEHKVLPSNAGKIIIDTEGVTIETFNLFEVNMNNKFGERIKQIDLSRK